MIIYFRNMRIKDEYKQEALFNATIKLVNETGFVASSVAKIAKEAGISPATIYIYYKNKDDLLVSTYVEIKKNLSIAALKNFDGTRPIRDILKCIWFNMFDFITKNHDHLQFTEQFANSPYSDLVNSEEVEKYFEPMFSVIQRGIDEKIIKNVNFEMISAFIFYPILILSNSRLCKTIEMDKKNIGISYDIAWDAIKL